MRIIKLSLLFFLFLPVFISAQNVSIDSLPKYSYATLSEIREQLHDIFNDPSFNSAQWGVIIQSPGMGDYFYKRNEDKLFIPASNLKLITTAAALHTLGKDYRFKTEIFSIGESENTVLKGDIIIRGFGDPTISGRFYADDNLKIFNDWADSLLEKGIDEIDGNIIGDDNAFDDTGLGDGWQWDYESDWFAAPSGALSFNDNCIDLLVSPTVAGEKAKLTMLPLTKYVTIQYNVFTVPKDSITDISVFRQRGTNIITVYGTIKENDTPKKLYTTISNPTQYFITVFKEVLQKKGIRVKGYATDIDDLIELPDFAKEKLLFTHYSPALPIILSIINKNSQNFFAEQLLKVMGFEKEKIGSAENGLSVVRSFLALIGINTDDIQIKDGSGLSRLNLITPKQLHTVLGYMSKQDYFTTYYNSLSIAGKSGTLSDRMVKTRAENNVRGKTGLLGNVRSLSGYLITGDNELLTFVIFVNNVTIPMKLADNIQDLVCIRLANFKRKN